MLPTDQSYCSTAYNCLRYSLSSTIDCALMPFRCVVSIISTIFCSCCYSSRIDINSLDKKIPIWINHFSKKPDPSQYSKIIKNPLLQDQSTDNTQFNQELAEFLNPLIKKAPDDLGIVYFNYGNCFEKTIELRIYDEVSLKTVQKMVSRHQWPHAKCVVLNAGERKRAAGKYIGYLRFQSAYLPEPKLY